MPVKIYILAFGIAVGLIVGALELDESIDLATAVGIVMGFSVAAGVWLGVRLYLAVTQIYKTWIAGMRKQITDIESHLLPTTSSTDERDIERLRDSLAISAAAYSIYPTPFFLCSFLINAIASVLWVQFDYARASMHFDFALAYLIALAAVVAIQCLYLLGLQWQVWSLERQLDRGGLVVPMVLNADVLDSSINRAERILRWVGGVGKPSGEQAEA